MQKPDLQRRVSAESVPSGLRDSTVGCAECHLLNPDKHRDTFSHNGKKVHTVVTPQDCATCHPEERSQFAENKMSQAHDNLTQNSVYQMLITSANGLLEVNPGDATASMQAPDRLSNLDSCLACHGSKLKVQGTKKRRTSLGRMEFPVIQNWPNQGVGRINPDGSEGSCTACHARHQFSISMARQPHTCSECHKGPDVPAYKVYQVSKHANIFDSVGSQWEMTAVPWTVGEDFTAPTCAGCHVSLLVKQDGSVVAERTHRMNDRLPWRIFGIPYAHPQPKSPDTTVIENEAGLPLPTELTGEPASEHLIDEQERSRRLERMQQVCTSCHSGQWVDGHFDKLERTLETTNHMTLQATRILNTAWQEGLAKGLDAGDSIANEPLELLWVEQWLFYGNSVRFASAMMGADYGVFANGRWQQHKNVREMMQRLELLRRMSD
jgi:hypothetical protein